MSKAVDPSGPLVQVMYLDDKVPSWIDASQNDPYIKGAAALLDSAAKGTTIAQIMGSRIYLYRVKP